MNTHSTTVHGSFAPEHGLPPTLRSFFWSIRRELWENRSVYIAPLIAGVMFLFGFVLNLFKLRQGLSSRLLDPEKLRAALTTRHDLAAALIMGTAFVVGIFYTIDALYGERRERSILFWKSLPVSDLVTTLSKLSIPIVVVPMISFAIALLAQFCMLLSSTVILAGSGADLSLLWTGTPFLRDSSALLYHLLAIHGLWYAPLYAWLLLVSAWAPRLPFLWAVLPPFVICGLEKIAFNTSYFLDLLKYRALGPGSSMAPEHHQEFMAILIPHHFFSSPGLWTGLLVAAVLVFLTARLRRYRGPI